MIKKIDMICDITYRLANFDIPLNQTNRSYSKLRKSTREVWSEYHTELLNKLKMLDNPEADYQLFWFECMSAPPISPRLYDLSGMPLSLPYQSLPTDYNENMGLHDSLIRNFSSEKNNLTANILLDSWDYESAELTFFNVSHFEYQNDKSEIELSLDRISDFCIISDGEAPVIDFCLKHLGIKKNEAMYNKRLFYFFSPTEAIYIFADSWEMKTY